MEENKQVTPFEGLDIALNQLNSISVPVVLTEQIAIPLARSIDLIKKCIPFLMEKPSEPKAEAKEEPEVKLEVLDGSPEEEEGESDE